MDVLNSHFQEVFGISKLQSTLLQLAYFVRPALAPFVRGKFKYGLQGAYFVFAPFAGIFVSVLFGPLLSDSVT